LHKEKVEQKVTAGEIQQSIYGVVAGELYSRRFWFSFTTLLYIFLFDSLVLFVHILVTVYSMFF